MDVFFEHFVESIFEKLGWATKKQFSMNLLGGGFWRSNDSNISVSSRMGSRPDLIIDVEQKTHIVELKYKHFELLSSRVKGDSNRGSDRDDRNQVLSFILSYMTAPAKDGVRFHVLYPLLSNNNGTIDQCSLVFPYASLNCEKRGSFLRVSEVSADSPLEVKFLGIPMLSALTWLSGEGENHFSSHFIEIFTSSQTEKKAV